MSDPIKLLLGLGDEPVRMGWVPGVSRGSQKIKAVWDEEDGKPRRPLYGAKAQKALMRQAKKKQQEQTGQPTSTPPVAAANDAPVAAAAPATRETVDEQLRQLASGTLAGLTGRTGYADLDRFRDELRTWAIAGGHLGQGRWQDVANAFLATHPHWNWRDVDRTFRETQPPADVYRAALDTPEDHERPGDDAGAIRYNRSLKGLSDVLTAQGRTVTKRDLADRWHYPLASGFRSLEQAVEAMDDVAKTYRNEAGFLKHGLDRRPGYGASLPNLRTVVAKTVPGVLEDADESARNMLERARDLDALKPGSEGAKVLRAAADAVAKAAMAYEDAWKSALERAEAANREATAREEEELTFDASKKDPGVRGWTAKEVLRELDKSKASYNLLVTARDTGYATNSRFLFKIPPKDLGTWSTATATAQGRGLSESMIRGVLETPHGDEPATVAGHRKRFEKDEVLLEVPAAKEGYPPRREVVDAKYLATIRRAWPGATMHLAQKPGEPVVFKEGGQPVAVLMPFAASIANAAKVRDKSQPPAQLSLAQQVFADAVRLSAGEWVKVKGERGSDKLWVNTATQQTKYSDGDPNKGAATRSREKPSKNFLKRQHNKLFPRWQRTGTTHYEGKGAGAAVDDWLQAATGRTAQTRRHPSEPARFVDRPVARIGVPQKADEETPAYNALRAMRKFNVMARNASRELETKTGGLPTRAKFAIARALSSEDFQEAVMDVLTESDVSKMAMKVVAIIASKIFGAAKKGKGDQAAKLSRGDDWTPMRALPYFRMALDAAGRAGGFRLDVPDGRLLAVLAKAWEGDEVAKRTVVDDVYEAIRLGWRATADVGGGKKRWVWDKQGERPKGSTVRIQVSEPYSGGNKKKAKSPPPAANKSQGQRDSFKGGKGMKKPFRSGDWDAEKIAKAYTRGIVTLEEAEEALAERGLRWPGVSERGLDEDHDPYIGSNGRISPAARKHKEASAVVKQFKGLVESYPGSRAFPPGVYHREDDPAGYDAGIAKLEAWQAQAESLLGQLATAPPDVVRALAREVGISNPKDLASRARALKTILRHAVRDRVGASMRATL